MRRANLPVGHAVAMVFMVRFFRCRVGWTALMGRSGHRAPVGHFLRDYFRKVQTRDGWFSPC